MFPLQVFPLKSQNTIITLAYHEILLHEFLIKLYLIYILPYHSSKYFEKLNKWLQ